MADFFYPKFKRSLLIGESGADLINGDVRVLLLSAAYTPAAAHQFLSDIDAVARIKASELLANKSVSATAAFDSDDASVLAVTSAYDVAAIALYLDTGEETTSRLVFFQNEGLAGVPFTPSGSDVVLTVNPSGWFTL
jgi:hypothetical protein